MIQSLSNFFESIGPTAPVFLIGSVFNFSVTAFFVIQMFLLRYWYVTGDIEFVSSLRQWSRRYARAGLLFGFIGTYVGIAESMPALAEVVNGKGTSAVAQVIVGLENAFQSTLAGLVIGVLWAGELNDFLLERLQALMQKGSNKYLPPSKPASGNNGHGRTSGEEAAPEEKPEPEKELT